MSYAQYYGQLFAMQQKRKMLGEFVYTKIMSAESCLETIASKHKDAAKEPEFQCAQEHLESIRAYLQEMS